MQKKGATMNWTLVNDRPIYIQLTEQITQYIVAGVFKPGTRMMSVRDLAADAGVNPNTMQRAFTELERSGLIVTLRNSGRVVTEDMTKIEAARHQLALTQVNSFIVNMRELGYNDQEILALIKSIVH